MAAAPAAAGEPWEGAPDAIRRRFAETRADWDAVSAEVPEEAPELT